MNKRNIIIGVGVVALAIAWYAFRPELLFVNLLGLKLAGESMNHGTEQEHLNNVAGARLRVSGLRAESGPGIEFLDYLTPKTGRPAPADTQANDLWHWQTTLSTTRAEMAVKRIGATRGRVVSPGVAEIPGKGLGFIKLSRSRSGRTWAATH